MLFLLFSVMAIQLWQICIAIKTNATEQVWVMHQTGNTVLFHQSGKRLVVAANSFSNVSGLVSDYRVAEGVNAVSHAPVESGYRWRKGELHIVGEAGFYLNNNDRPQYLLLKNSPKVNLDRLLDEATPAAVIADGSNYTSFIGRWRISCKARGVPFHNTATDGAYRLPLN